MFSTWDRYPAVNRSDRDAAHGRRQADPLGHLMAGIDVMIYIAGAAFAACVVTIFLA